MTTKNWKTLRLRRLGYDIQQQEMAEALGCNPSWISLHERGRYRGPNSAKFAEQYAEALQEKIDAKD